VEYGGEPQIFDEWKDFSTMPGELITKVWKDSSLFNRVAPYPGAIEMMVALNLSGAELYIVTRPGRNPEITVPAKIAWVKEWMPWFNIRNFTTMFPKWHFKADMIIDDHPPIVDKWRKHNPDGMPVLFQQKWNMTKVEWLRRRGAYIAEDFSAILDLADVWAEELIERGA
jgi:5'(3')-deoxyribonucleotidase